MDGPEVADCLFHGRLYEGLVTDTASQWQILLAQLMGGAVKGIGIEVDSSDVGAQFDGQARNAQANSLTGTGHDNRATGK
ncbi:hypothetical protein D3C85_1625820 [compost metagenome]